MEFLRDPPLPFSVRLGYRLVFQAAVSAGLAWLAVVAARASVIGFYYYLRVVLQMYLRPASSRPEVAAPGRMVGLLVVVTVVLTVALGLGAQALITLLHERPLPASVAASETR